MTSHPPPAVKRKRMPKLVYNLMRDAELRRRLNEAGLSTSGDRSTLVRRHQELTLRFNAESDSLDPKSGKDTLHTALSRAMGQ